MSSFPFHLSFFVPHRVWFWCMMPSVIRYFQIMFITVSILVLIFLFNWFTDGSRQWKMFCLKYATPFDGVKLGMDFHVASIIPYPYQWIKNTILLSFSYRVLSELLVSEATIFSITKHSVSRWSSAKVSTFSSSFARLFVAYYFGFRAAECSLQYFTGIKPYGLRK